MKYPHIQDQQLQNKVYLKKEFQHFYESNAEKDIEQEDEKGVLCASTEFELAPHQMFVKTFLSNNTPYNGLLLYHGMGSGKTCSAIVRSFVSQISLIMTLKLLLLLLLTSKQILRVNLLILLH